MHITSGSVIISGGSKILDSTAIFVRLFTNHSCLGSEARASLPCDNAYTCHAANRSTAEHSTSRVALCS